MRAHFNYLFNIASKFSTNVQVGPKNGTKFMAP